MKYSRLVVFLRVLECCRMQKLEVEFLLDSVESAVLKSSDLHSCKSEEILLIWILLIWILLIWILLVWILLIWISKPAKNYNGIKFCWFGTFFAGLEHFTLVWNLQRESSQKFGDRWKFKFSRQWSHETLCIDNSMFLL